VFWHAGYVLNDSVIRPYLTGKSVLAPKHLTCPSDDPNSHPYGYKFSYTVNWMICEPRGDGWPDGGVYPPFKKMYSAPGDTRWRPNLKSTGIHAPSTCIMVIDESSATADDGCFAYYNHDGLQTANTWNNILSNRHDKRGEKKQLLKEGRGNVAFCDGHAEFISRLDAVNQKFWDPRKKGMPATPFGQGPGPGGSYP
jgi:prepilin-type processing-associated H-X9-DG protein